MLRRTFARASRSTGVIGLGTWQLGADWGDVDESTALATLSAAVAAGVTFLDTADVYGDGRSERIIGRFLRQAGPAVADQITVATKMGRRVEQRPENYTRSNFRAWTDRSRRNLGVDALDLVQLKNRWIIDHPEVTVVIPGARRPDQAVANVAAGELPALSAEVHRAVRQIYDELVRPVVHHRW